jgi:hypothetical protein
LTKQRLNAQEAVEVLGISVDAVRMRARRGTLDSEHENGRLYVWLDSDETSVYPQAHIEALLQEKDSRIEELLEQVHHLREVLGKEGDARRRADTIIAQLTQANAALAARVPELEAPHETSGGLSGPPDTSEHPIRTEAQEGIERMSWWRRVFGG